LFESLAHVAQAVEHFLGKEEVTGSIPVVSSGSLIAMGRWIVCRRS
jgi:predicted membrane-bound mannosyltransferase